MTLEEVTFINEFAEVRVRVVETRTGRLLELHAPRLDSTVRLDTFALELLSQLDPAALSDLLQHTYERPEPNAPGGSA